MRAGYVVRTNRGGKRLRRAVVFSAMIAGTAIAGPGDVGRRLLAEYGDAIVLVRAIVAFEAPGLTQGWQEREVRAFGTVVGPEGLVAASHTSLSPFAGLTEVFEAGGIRPSMEVRSVRVRLRDGSEVPARQILVDEESDVVFLAPEKDSDRQRAWPRAVVFSAGVQAQPLDPLVGLAGTAELFAWISVVGSAEVNAVVGRPRKIYLITRPFSNATGVPLFLEDGRPLGLSVLRRETTSAVPGRGAQVQQAVVVLSADELVPLIERAFQVLRRVPQANGP